MIKMSRGIFVRARSYQNFNQFKFDEFGIKYRCNSHPRLIGHLEKQSPSPPLSISTSPLDTLQHHVRLDP